MRLGRRVVAIYNKELVELFRDRRTLIAMIVVPIALYPLLIVGSVHLLSIQDSERRALPLPIAVPDAEAPLEIQVTQDIIQYALGLAAEKFKNDAIAEGNDPEADERIASIRRMTLVAVEDVRAAVASGAYLLGVEIRTYVDEATGFEQIRITPCYDRAEISSESALRRLNEVLDVFTEQEQIRWLQRFNTPAFVLNPVEVEPLDLAPPIKVGGMVLGSIVPLVLVLMTITGAIYPAIDLTAGERERGTLETLIVTPASTMELITGKYLVVATVALMGAALNLASMGATLYFGGFTQMIAESGETELPLGVLPVILVALVPFALLFAAVMVAVCSCARTFKEAQNYIMPVILTALIPGGIAAMPGTEFTGVRTVVPVMNMVLMARELLLGNYEWAKIALVLLSTSLYAAIAVVIASRVFSTEAVVFADAASLRSVFVRKRMKPRGQPAVTLVLIVTALLFPVWMYVQFAIQPTDKRAAIMTFIDTARYMPLCLVLLPALLCAYFKINLIQTLRLALPRPRFLVAAMLIGIAAWAPAHELFLVQTAIFGAPDALLASDSLLQDAFANRSLWWPMLLIAIVPAFCEELFFRGFLFSGLSTAARRWTVILATACIFGVFHFLLVRFAITASLGVLLGYLCWQSRSIWPAIVAHLLHNATAVLIVFWPPYTKTIGIADHAPTDHLPLPLVAIACVTVVAGILLVRVSPKNNDQTASQSMAPPLQSPTT